LFRQNQYVMDTKVLLAALAGAVTSFLTGWIIWGMALKSFMESNTSEACVGCSRGEEMVLWALFIGCFAWSLLLALLFSRWAGISTFKSGAMAGIWVGFLIALGMDFFMYAGSHMFTMNAVIVDIIANAIQGALVGGVVGLVLGYGEAK